MRTNLPVTGVERTYGEDEMLVSKTDLRGVITYANPEFVKISGFTHDELIGAPHNLVRHPDMPAEAFQDLWEKVQKGKFWSALVKNRSKNGDHYWVEANVSPIKQGGSVVGYVSVRRKPSRSEVEAAESLYARIRAGKAKLGASGVRARYERMSIAGKLSLMTFLVLFACLLGLSAFTQWRVHHRGRAG